jgi:hypothetical protein
MQYKLKGFTASGAGFYKSEVVGRWHGALVHENI